MARAIPLALAALLASHTAAAARSVSFVACPVAQDTGPETDLCFFAEHQGTRYALVNPPDFGEPQLGHKVLVEGVPKDGAPPRCGGVVLEGRVSVLFELSRECDQLVPPTADAAARVTPAAIAEAERQVAADPRRSLASIPLPPPVRGRVARGQTETIYYPFDSDRSSGPDAQRMVDLARLAMTQGTARVSVVAHRGGSRLDDGTRLTEGDTMARRRAEKVRGILEGLGVPADRIAVRWNDRTGGYTGKEDWKQRRVEIRVD